MVSLYYRLHVPAMDDYWIISCLSLHPGDLLNEVSHGVVVSTQTIRRPIQHLKLSHLLGLIALCDWRIAMSQHPLFRALILTAYFIVCQSEFTCDSVLYLALTGQLHRAALIAVLFTFPRPILKAHLLLVKEL